MCNVIEGTPHALGIGEADSFSKKLAAGYATTDTIASGVKSLALAGKLDKSSAQSMLDANATALAGLKAVETLHATNPEAAATRLQLIVCLREPLTPLLRQTSSCSSPPSG